jgi:hypothetical protein
VAAIRAIGKPPPRVQWVHVGDRGEDLFGVYDEARRQGTDWLIRVCQDRRILTAAGEERLFTYARSLPVRIRQTVTIRRRPAGVPEEVIVCVSGGAAKLRPSRNEACYRKSEPVDCWITSSALDDGYLKFLPIGQRNHQSVIHCQHARIVKRADPTAGPIQPSLQQVSKSCLEPLFAHTSFFHGRAPLVLFAIDVFGQAGSQEVHDRLGNFRFWMHVPAAIEIDDLLLIGKSLEPKLRDAAVTQFVIGAFGVLGKYEGIKEVAAYGANHPSSATRCPTGRFGNSHVVANLIGLGFDAVCVAFAVGSHVCSPCGFWDCLFVCTSTHEPCFARKLKRNVPQVGRNFVIVL